MKRNRIAAPDLCPECGASWDCGCPQRKPEKRESDDADRIAAAIARDTEESRPRHRTWRDQADWHLARLFDNGNFTPAPKEIFDAYPFYERKYFPYKVWCQQVKWWRAGCPARRGKPKPVGALPGQAVLL